MRLRLNCRLQNETEIVLETQERAYEAGTLKMRLSLNRGLKNETETEMGSQERD